MNGNDVPANVGDEDSKEVVIVDVQIEIYFQAVSPMLSGEGTKI